VTSTIRWTGTVTAVSSIAHGGQRLGTTTLLRREKMDLPLATCRAAPGRWLWAATRVGTCRELTGSRRGPMIAGLAGIGGDRRPVADGARAEYRVCAGGRLRRPGDRELVE